MLDRRSLDLAAGDKFFEGLRCAGVSVISLVSILPEQLEIFYELLREFYASEVQYEQLAFHAETD